MVQGAREVRAQHAESTRATTHRASYILERGRWNATCRDCGWQTSSAKRQVTASMFRLHIQAMRMTAIGGDGNTSPVPVDLPG